MGVSSLAWLSRKPLNERGDREVFKRIRHWLRGRGTEDDDLVRQCKDLEAELNRQEAELKRQDAKLGRLYDPIKQRLEVMRREYGDAVAKVYMERVSDMLHTMIRALEDGRKGRMDFLKLEQSLERDKNRVVSGTMETLVELDGQKKKQR